MTLALAHSHPAPAFNGLFYATAATVIPVLFVAIAVQGDAYQELLKAAVRSAARSRQKGKVPFASWLLWALGFSIVIYGAVGELVALAELLRQQGGLLPESFVWTSVTFLTFAAAAGPATSAVRFTLADTKAARHDRASPRDASMPEPGKPAAG